MEIQLTQLLLLALTAILFFITGFLIGFVKLERNPDQMKKEEHPNKNFLSELLNGTNNK